MSVESKPAAKPVGVLATLVATVVLMGWSPPARAALILRDVNVTLNASNIETFDLDVDRNGTIDFTFTAAFAPDPFFTVGFATVDFPFASNNAAVIDLPRFDNFPTVSRLGLGDTVSAGSTFSFLNDQGNLFFSIPFDPPSGNFGGQTGFVGLRFAGPGGTFFGFAEVTVNAIDAADNPLGLRIGTVGFESVAGQPARITAIPEPASLAVVGAVAVGLLARRRRAGPR